MGGSLRCEISLVLFIVGSYIFVALVLVRESVLFSSSIVRLL